MSQLDHLLAAEKNLRTKVDYVAMFKRDPAVVKYCLDARAQHAAAVEARDRVASDMEKIRRLTHGTDMRFHALRDLVGLLEEFDLSCSAIVRFGEGEAWLDGLTNAQFHPQRIWDWREQLIRHMRDELEQYFQGVFGVALALDRIHDRANWIISDVVLKNPRPLVASVASYGFEPVVPAAKGAAHTTLNNLDE
jgi:hypothetical protein